MPYYMEDTGVYVKCYLLGNLINPMLPMGDLGLDWEFDLKPENNPNTDNTGVFAAGSRLLVNGDMARDIYAARVKSFREQYCRMINNLITDLPSAPTLGDVRNCGKANAKKVIIDLFDNEDCDQVFRREMEFFSKIRHLLDWAFNAAKTFGFVTLLYDSSLPTGSFGFSLIENSCTNPKFDNDFFESINSQDISGTQKTFSIIPGGIGGIVFHASTIEVGGAVVQSAGRWGIHT